MFSWSRRKILTFYSSKEILLLLYCARVLSLKYINMIKQNSYKMSISRVPIVILNILKTVSVMFGETKKVRLYLASKIVFVLWKRLRSLTGFQMFYTDLHLRFCFFSNGEEYNIHHLSMQISFPVPTCIWTSFIFVYLLQNRYQRRMTLTFMYHAGDPAVATEANGRRSQSDTMILVGRSCTYIQTLLCHRKKVLASSLASSQTQ